MKKFHDDIYSGAQNNMGQHFRATPRAWQALLLVCMYIHTIHITFFLYVCNYPRDLQFIKIPTLQIPTYPLSSHFPPKLTPNFSCFAFSLEYLCMYNTKYFHRCYSNPATPSPIGDAMLLGFLFVLFIFCFGGDI